MKHVFFPILFLASAISVSAQEILTPETILRGSRNRYTWGTNYLARGMFREADKMFQWAIEMSRNGLAELGDGASTGELGQGIPDKTGLEAEFRILIADLERARKETATEREKPLDAGRALGIARDYYEEARRLIESRGSAFNGAYDALAGAEGYLRDIWQAGKSDEESFALEGMLAIARQSCKIRAFRHQIGEARRHLRSYRFNLSKRSVLLAVRHTLDDLARSGLFPDLVADLRKEAEDMTRAVDLSASERCLATGDREIARTPRRNGTGGAAKKPLKEELAETDLVGNLPHALDEPFVRISVARDPQRGDTDIPKEKWDDVFNTLRHAEETRFPEVLNVSCRFHVEFVLSEDEEFDVRTAPWESRREVFRDSPAVLFLDAVILKEEPDNAYLDFPGCLDELFTPGGKSLKIPGFRALMERILPPERPQICRPY